MYYKASTYGSGGFESMCGSLFFVEIDDDNLSGMDLGK